MDFLKELPFVYFIIRFMFTYNFSRLGNIQFYDIIFFCTRLLKNFPEELPLNILYLISYLYVNLLA